MTTLADFKDKHVNSTAFILGAGPSLRLVDNHMFDCGVTFAVNSAILKKPDCDYWVSDDQDTANWSYFKEVVLPSRAIKFVDKDRLGKVIPERDDVVRYARQRLFDWYDPYTKRYNVPKVSLTRDTEKPLAGTRTSVATAIHIAWIMGFKQVVLVGCDCEYQDGKRWFWEFGGYGEQTRSGADRFPNHLVKDATGMTISDTHCVEMFTFWKVFAMALKGRIGLYNASGGIMTGVARRSLDYFSCRIKENAPRDPN